MSTEHHDPLTELESSLAGLAPAAPRLDRDSLLYAAGRAAGAQRWKRATLGLAVVVLTLGSFVSLRPVRERERIVTQIVPAAIEPQAIVESSPSSASPVSEPIAHAEEFEGPKSSPQLEMRWRMLRWGPDAVPIAVGGSEVSSRPLEQDLDLSPGSLKGADLRRNIATSPW